jgi:hypothetical protein
LWQNPLTPQEKHLVSGFMLVTSQPTARLLVKKLRFGATPRKSVLLLGFTVGNLRSILFKNFLFLHVIPAASEKIYGFAFFKFQTGDAV